MDERSFTTHEVANFCKVTMLAVVKWIKQGKLAAYKTPGGHRRVLQRDLMQFLKKYELPMPTELESLGKKRVLIVDDDEAVFYAVQRALEKIVPKPEIKTATNGFEAGQMVENFFPDLVILDLRLPGIDGFHVCSMIKSTDRIRDIKVIAMTGYHSPENQKKAMEAGADDYLTKPFQVSELNDKVSKILNDKESVIIM